jgi:hypothetical protein
VKTMRLSSSGSIAKGIQPVRMAAAQKKEIV